MPIHLEQHAREAEAFTDWDALTPHVRRLAAEMDKPARRGRPTLSKKLQETLADRARIGLALLTMMQESLPRLLTLTKRGRGKKAALLLRLAHDAETHYDLDTLSRAAARRPMLEPPKDWTATERGGYRYALEDTVPPVRNMRATLTDA